MGVGGYRHAPAALSPENRPSTHCTRHRWAPGPIRTSAENFASTGIRTPDRSGRSSRYTDYVIPPYKFTEYAFSYYFFTPSTNFVTVEWQHVCEVHTGKIVKEEEV